LDYVPEERELTHQDLKMAVEKRDLFCWDKEESQGAHIIAQKKIGMADDELSVLVRALFGAWPAVLNRRMTIALMMIAAFLLTT